MKNLSLFKTGLKMQMKYQNRMVPSCMNKSKFYQKNYSNLGNIGFFNQPQIRNFSATAAAHGEPRFLDQVRLFLNRAASQVDIDPDYYQLI